MESAHHSLSRPDCNNTAEVPSFTLRTALLAIPFVSALCGVDVQWFQDYASQGGFSALFEKQQAHLLLHSRERSRIQIQRIPIIPDFPLMRQVSPSCHLSTRQGIHLSASLPAAMSVPGSKNTISFFAEEELAGTVEDKFIAGFGFVCACLMWCHATSFLVLDLWFPLIELEQSERLQKPSFKDQKLVFHPCVNLHQEIWARLLLSCVRLMSVSCTSNLLVQMLSPPDVDLESSRSPTKSDSRYEPIVHCCAVLPT